MKIAFTGKGGSGKTTVAASLILYLAGEGRKVLAVDADPDPNLAGALGFENPRDITPICGMKGLIYERMGVTETDRSFFKLNPDIDDIPQRFSKTKGSIKLIVMGWVERGGSGCVCPESEFLKSLLKKLVVSDEEWAVIDMEAGVEHLGRKTAQATDVMAAVVEPSMRSIETALRIRKLAADIGIKRFVCMANKIRGNDDIELIKNNLKGIDVIAEFDFNEEILQQDKKERQDLLADEKIKKASGQVYKRLQELSQAK